MTADTYSLYKDGVTLDGTGYSAWSSGGSGVSVTYTQVKDIQGLSNIGGGSATDIETTNMDSTAKEYLTGLKDNGEMSVDYNWVGADAGQILCETGLRNSTTLNWKLTLSDTKVLNFDGAVKSKSLNAGTDGALQGSMTVRITGEITLITPV